MQAAGLEMYLGNEHGPLLLRGGRLCERVELGPSTVRCCHLENDRELSDGD